MANVDNEDSGNLDQQEFNLFAESSVTVEVHNFLSARLRAPVYVIVIFYFSCYVLVCQWAYLGGPGIAFAVRTLPLVVAVFYCYNN
ncbi:hypothetical protein SAMN02910323_2416 [Selenomonas ruminantium]|uniref:Uncharacterized protein n=1 Tax=Selenomonas ruminantium TaxID=971 RepID=A0A1K1Q6S4_SELRU|nr:hypothetical protein SAMN02910323_2416 [Selenomonas ruminantium]